MQTVSYAAPRMHQANWTTRDRVRDNDTKPRKNAQQYQQLRRDANVDGDGDDDYRKTQERRDAEPRLNN